MKQTAKKILNEQVNHSSEIENCTNLCKKKFNQILSEVLNGGQQEAHQIETSIFTQLMKLGLLLMQLFFTNQNKGNYGKTIETDRGTAKRNRTKKKFIFQFLGRLH